MLRRRASGRWNRYPGVKMSEPFARPDHYGAAITSLILGIFGLAAWLVPICGLPMAVIGLILGIVGKDSSRRGMAVAGIVLAIITLVLGIVNASIGAYQGFTGQFFR